MLSLLVVTVVLYPSKRNRALIRFDGRNADEFFWITLDSDSADEAEENLFENPLVNNLGSGTRKF